MAKKPDFVKEGPGFADVTLAAPIEIAGAQVSTIRMREPTVGDSEAVSEMSGSDAAREIKAFANLCDLSPEDIRKLTMRNFKRLQIAYTGFTD